MSAGVGFRQPLRGSSDAKKDGGEDKRARHVEALVQRAVFEYKRGELARARMLGKYLMEAERCPDGWKIFAVTSHQLGDEDAAWSCYPAALEHFPRDVNVIVGYAELCINRHVFDKAKTLLALALELDPEARHPAGAKARVLIMRAQLAA